MTDHPGKTATEAAELYLARSFATTHPDGAARVLDAMPPDDAAEALKHLAAADAAAPAVARMDRWAAARALAGLSDDTAVAILARLTHPTIVQILRAVPAERRDRLIDPLPPRVAGALRRSLEHPPGTAGAVMDPFPVTVTPDTSVSEARNRLLNANDKAYYFVYVTDREGTLRGVVDLRQLICADPSDRIGTVMRSEPIAIPATMALEVAALHHGWREVDNALPVVDDKGVLIGMIRHRDVRSSNHHRSDTDLFAAAYVAALSLGALYLGGAASALGGALPTSRKRGSDDPEA